ncbi:hypothetical protein [Neogemmobacter tilapiae]|uniref:DUF2178 domain-containing protein n=1 Tax=Neogemmobacter tilapiae TaxID=875041 RepID=A0A918WQ55_9RHOB|nr:hypothetical protein [Gemmobacter tilapiae]GHC65667.1 hypothetical protein GCM10007315_32740 [Gemmobacter tilapiae]
MSGFEKLHLWGLGLLVLAYGVFVLVMTDGGQLASQTPGRILTILLVYLVVVGLALGTLFVRGLEGRTQPDERESAIDGRGERAGYYGVETGLAVLMLLVLADAWGSGILGSFRLDRPEAVVFALVTVSTIGGICRFLAGWRAARVS